MLQVSENEVDKSEISDAGSIWTDEDEDLPNSESTDGKNMRLCIAVLPDKQTYDKTTSAGLFPGLDLFGEMLKLIYDMKERLEKFWAEIHCKLFSLGLSPSAPAGDGPDYQYIQAPLKIHKCEALTCLQYLWLAY